MNSLATQIIRSRKMRQKLFCQSLSLGNFETGYLQALAEFAKAED